MWEISWATTASSLASSHSRQAAGSRMVERSAPIVTGTEMNSDSAADGTKAIPAARACEASLVVRRASSIICDAFSRRRLNPSPTQMRARRKSATTRYVPAATALQGIEAGGQREVASVTVGAFVVVGSVGRDDGDAWVSVTVGVRLRARAGLSPRWGLSVFGAVPRLALWAAFLRRSAACSEELFFAEACSAMAPKIRFCLTF